LGRQQGDEEARREQILDPPVVRTKGRPQTARLTSCYEGCTKGGGGHGRTRQIDDSSSEEGDGDIDLGPSRKRARSYKCGRCGGEGHNCTHCPIP
jgi:hypothetical protein